jgi:hypothetical protein
MAGTYYNFSGTSCSTSILTQLTTDATNSAPVLGEVYSGYTSGDYYTVTDTGVIEGIPLGVDVDTSFDFVTCPGQCYEISNGDGASAHDVSYIDNLGITTCTTLAQLGSPGDTQTICISAGTSTSIVGYSSTDGSCSGFAVVIGVTNLTTFCQNPGECVPVSPTPTQTPTETPTPTPTQTPINTLTPTNTGTPTQTPTQTLTPTSNPTLSCGGSYNGSYSSLTFTTQTVNLNLSSTPNGSSIFMEFEAVSRPNRFAIYEDGVSIYSSGYIGSPSSVPGPWNPPSASPANTTFTYDSSKTYYVLIDIAPDNISDSYTIDLICTAPAASPTPTQTPS